MKDKKNIDKIIAGKARSFEQAPPPEIWENIHAQIQPGRKKLIPLFWRYAAGIAILMAVGTSIYLGFRNSSEFIHQNLNSENTENLNKTNESGTIISTPSELQLKKEIKNQDLPVSETKPTNPDQKKENFISPVEENRAPIAVIAEESGHITPGKEDENRTGGNLNSIFTNFRNPLQKQPGSAKRDEIRKQDFSREYSWDDLLAEEVFTEERKRELSLSAMMSPIYSYRDITESSYNQYFNENESGRLSYSGGLEVGFRASDRLSIHTGLVYSKMGYSIDGVSHIGSRANVDWLSTKSALPRQGKDLLVSNSIGSIAGEVDYSNQSSFEAKTNAASNDESSMEFLNDGALNSSAPLSEGNLSLDQFLHFMEVPFNLRYTLIDRGIDLKLIGGISTNFLVGNQVNISQGSSTEYLGKTNDIKSVNYSGNIGFGIDYNFRENILFIMEPQFKYYLNSINKSFLIGNRPYSLGFYTGVRYIFN